MIRFFSAITMVYGIILLLSAIPKFMGGFATTHFQIGPLYIDIPNGTSYFYIISVNCIGGLSYLIYGIRTRKFNFSIPIKRSDMESLEEYKSIAYRKPLSNLDIMTGIIIFLISFLMLIKLMMTLSGVGSMIDIFWPIIVIVLIVQLPFIVLPAIQVLRNFDVNKRIISSNRSLSTLKK